MYGGIILSHRPPTHTHIAFLSLPFLWSKAEVPPYSFPNTPVPDIGKGLG